MQTLNIEANRQAQKWSRREQIGRLLWAIATPLFRFSPRPLWGWRRVILRSFNATVGRDVHVYPTVRITIPWNLTLQDGCAVGNHAILYALGPIKIGERATVSQYAHLCAGSHDWRDPSMPLLKPPITIGNDVWICADAYIGPGVSVEQRSIIGARAVITKDVSANSIMAGNPARLIGKTDT